MSVQSRSPIQEVLAIRPFRLLWSAQALAQTAQNAYRFILIILIEKLTGSTMHLGFIILAFTLPGAVLGPVAGVFVDRWPKKWILTLSNFLRVLLVLSFVPVLHFIPGRWAKVLTIYALTLVTSSIGQFFAPAETAAIPMIVGEEALMAANSLFNFTLAGAQAFGWVILAPLILKLFGVEAAFAIMAAFYAIATVLVYKIDMQEEAHEFVHVAESVEDRWLTMLSQIKEGWSFVIRHPKIYLSLGYLTLVSTLLMVIGMIGPGFASRVLGLSAEDSYIMFAPAGIGMIATTVVLGVHGHNISRRILAHGAIAGTAFGFWGLYAVSKGYNRFHMPLFHFEPEAFLNVTTSVIVLSFILGVTMTTLNIVGQTNLQEATPPDMRGRVFSIQFVMGSVVSAIPMLVIGGLADAVGIPTVMGWIGYSLAFVLLLNYWLYRRASKKEILG